MNIETKIPDNKYADLNLSQLLRAAKKHLSCGNIWEAENLYFTILQRYPGNKIAKVGLSKLKKANPIPNLVPLIEQKRFVEAEKILIANLDRDHQNPNFWKLLGYVYKESGNRSLSLQSFQKALELQPNDHDLMFTIGVDFLQSNEIANAFKLFKILNKVQPSFSGAYTNIGIIYDKVDKFEKAKAEWLKAIEVNSKDTVALTHLGINEIKNFGQHTEALTYFERVSKLEPEDINNCINIATAYFEMGKVEEALEIYKHWEDKNWKGATEQEKLDFRLNYSLALFCTKQTTKAWDNYASRIHTGGICPTELHNLSFPMLEQLEDAFGKKIVILMEQGIGDQLFYLGLIKSFLKKTKTSITIQTEPRLVPLLSHSLPNIRITTEIEAENIFGDYWLLCGDLGRILNITEQSAKMCQPYIKTKPDIVNLPEDIFSKEKLNIGLVWRSGLVNGRRLQNYTKLADWEPLVDNPKYNFINLQYGDISADLEELNEDSQKNIRIPDIDLENDFIALGSIINKCDVVVGPMTAPIVQSMAQGINTFSYGLKGKDRYGFGRDLLLRKYQNAWYQNTTHFVFQQHKKDLLVQTITEQLNHLKDNCKGK